MNRHSVVKSLKDAGINVNIDIYPDMTFMPLQEGLPRNSSRYVIQMGYVDKQKILDALSKIFFVDSVEIKELLTNGGSSLVTIAKVREK